MLLETFAAAAPVGCKRDNLVSPAVTSNEASDYPRPLLDPMLPSDRIRTCRRSYWCCWYVVIIVRSASTHQLVAVTTS